MSKNKFDPANPIAGKFLGHEQHLYRSVDAVANSDLLLIERNPSDYIWNREAPSDPSKTGTIDLGTAIHTALLEPELFAKSVAIYTATKSRDTVKFAEFEQAPENEGKIVLLEKEYDQLRLMVDSAHAHPTMRRFLTANGDNECSIYAKDEGRGIMRKIRPDRDLIGGGIPLLCDLKKTASIEDWREGVRWRNPLFKFNYGHTAAYYMDTASIHYSEQINEYAFLLVQSSVEMGKYPVAVITVTREELQQYGFFDRMNANLDKYAECRKSDNWYGVERFPVFR